MQNSQELVKEFYSLLKGEAELDRQLKETRKLVYKKQQQLYDKMVEEELNEITYKDVKFEPKVDQDFSLAGNKGHQKWDDHPSFFKWLRDNNMADIIKTRQSVHPSTRKATLKEWIENGNSLPNFIEEKMNPVIKYKKTHFQNMAKNNE